MMPQPIVVNDNPIQNRASRDAKAAEQSGPAAVAPGGNSPQAVPPTWIIAALIGIAAAVPFLPSLGHALVWDDLMLQPLVDALARRGGVAGVLRSGFMLQRNAPLGYYRPVVLFSFWLNGAIGAGPPGYHLLNILLHAVATALVFGLARSCGAATRAAAAGALVFAVHPVHVESVVFVSGRTDLFAAVFALAAALAWVRVAGGATRTPRVERALGGVAFGLAALSKEAAWVLPGVLLAWDALGVPGGAPHRTPWWRRNGAWLVIWALVLGGVLALRWSLGVGLGAASPPRSGMASTWARLGDAAAALASYLRLLVVPWPLKINYDAGDLRIGLLGAAVVLAAILTVALTARRSAGRVGPTAAVWVVGFLIPVLGVIPIQASSIAERFLYLPSAGLAWFVALMLDRVPARSPARRVAAAGLFAVVGLLATGSVLRARVWKDEPTLFEDAIRASPGYLDGYTNLATAYGRAGRHEDAIHVLRRALEIAPDSPAALLNLGSALGALGRTEEAIQCFRRAVALDPGSVDGLMNLATAYLTLGRIPDAAAALEAAVRVDPESTAAQAMLGHALLALGHADAAMLRFRRALALDPRDGPAHFGVGLVSLARGDPGEAERQRRILESFDPALAEQLASRMARGR